MKFEYRYFDEMGIQSRILNEERIVKTKDRKIQRIYLARHGKISGHIIGERSDLHDISWLNSKDGSKHQPFDAQLTMRGSLQARDLGTYLRKFGINLLYFVDIENIYTSPLLRCVQTASYISSSYFGNNKITNNKYLKIENGLIDVLLSSRFDSNFSLKTLIPPNYLREIMGPLVDINYDSGITPKYPESVSEATERIRDFLDDLLDRHQESNLLIITHTLVINAICCIFRPGFSNISGFPPCSLTEITVIRDKDLNIIDVEIPMIGYNDFIRTTSINPT